MIEDPSTTVISQTKIAESDEVDASLGKAPLIEEVVAVMQQQPITASIRRTTAHLQSVGGFAARWRGLAVSVAYGMAHGLLMHSLLMIFGIALFRPAMTFVCSIISTLLLARLHMTWTHVVISKPSKLPWFKRIPGRETLKVVALPALRVAMAQQLVLIMPALTFFAWGGEVSFETDAQQQDMVMRVLATFATALFVAAGILMPAMTQLTRIEASLLPADVDTIVPFDRTMGGLLTSADSWRKRLVVAMSTIDGAAYRRVLWYCVKAACVLLMTVTMATYVISLEIGMMGPERLFAFAKKFVEEAERAHP